MSDDHSKMEMPHHTDGPANVCRCRKRECPMPSLPQAAHSTCIITSEPLVTMARVSYVLNLPKTAAYSASIYSSESIIIKYHHCYAIEPVPFPCGCPQAWIAVGRLPLVGWGRQSAYPTVKCWERCLSVETNRHVRPLELRILQQNNINTNIINLIVL